jgi:serine/threonine protein kinase
LIVGRYKVEIARTPQQNGSTQQPVMVGDRYRLEATLGRGGMGVVFAAMHVHTQRPVALKLMHCPWNDETLALYQRFLGEARAASAVRHRNVVDVLDMGYHAGTPYLVMERLYGVSLDRVLEQDPVLPLHTVLDWLLPVMGALAVLHEAGIVHRDIKPSNLFLARDAAQTVLPKLLDFGLAQAAWEAPLTEPGVLLGTPEYMAPERARGQRVGPGADIWAMGVVLFECLCGRVPFTASTMNGVAAQIVSGELLKTQAANPNVPASVAAVIDRALAPAPDDRHRSMAWFAYDLAHAAYLAGVTLPQDPDPVGLPSFGMLSQNREAWVSGPLAAPAESTLRLLVRPRAGASDWLRRMTLATLALSLFGLGSAGWRMARVGETPHARSVPAPPPPPAPSLGPNARLSAPEREPALRPTVISLDSAEPAPLPRDVAHVAGESTGERARRREAPGASGPPSRRAPGSRAAAPPATPATAAHGELEKEWL